LERIEDSYEPLASLSRNVGTLVQQYVADADQQLQDYWQLVTSIGKQLQQQQLTVPTAQVQPAQTKDRQKPGRRRRRQRQLAARKAKPADSLEDIRVSNSSTSAISMPETLANLPETIRTSSTAEVSTHAARRLMRNMPMHPS
ncbi:hypothetical protein DVH05_014691, partial [Phytophthora capsici]